VRRCFNKVEEDFLGDRRDDAKVQAPLSAAGWTRPFHDERRLS
jgi:hypothetical protein